jgi:hypothetical protein
VYVLVKFISCFSFFVSLIVFYVLDYLQDIGEEALVLGQLLGYDDARERLAVLDAGLTVRGIDFAKQMAALTEEALEGFTRVPCGADPDLVERVSQIDSRLREFIEEQKTLQ